MKKVLYFLVAVVLLTGCSCTANMGNTPTKNANNVFLISSPYLLLKLSIIVC